MPLAHEARLRIGTDTNDCATSFTGGMSACTTVGS